MDVSVVGHGHRLARLEPPTPEHGAGLSDRDGGVVALARCDRDQSAAVEFGIDVELLVAGIDRLGVGADPHLDEVDVVAARVVHLRMPDAASGGHPLREARVDGAAILLRVLVFEFTREHPGDDLHVAVGVRVEAAAGVDDVVVVDEQEPVMGVREVAVVSEGERVLRLEPAGVRLEPIG